MIDFIGLTLEDHLVDVIGALNLCFGLYNVLQTSYTIVGLSFVGFAACLRYTISQYCTILSTSHAISSNSQSQIDKI